MTPLYFQVLGKYDKFSFSVSFSFLDTCLLHYNRVFVCISKQRFLACSFSLFQCEAEKIILEKVEGFKQIVCFYYKETKDKKDSNLLPIFVFVSMSYDYLCHRRDMKTTSHSSCSHHHSVTLNPCGLFIKGPICCSSFPERPPKTVCNVTSDDLFRK